jgi:UDPglucose 6-dehydrogenase
MTKIGFIGLGKLGLVCAETIADNGHDVTGYDISVVTSDLVAVKASVKEAVTDREIVFVAVPTPHLNSYGGETPTSNLEPRDFDYSIVKQVLTECNKHMNQDQLLVLISTVLPGTTRREFMPLISNTRFVYNPYLIAMGSIAWDMVNPEMVMVGTADGLVTGDARELINFYKTIMKNNPRYVVGTWDECECIKIFYNTFISAKIGLVNMIQDVAERQGNINVDIVTKALAESTMRIMGPQYMTAGMGDGGACHPRDNIALRWLSKELNLGYDMFEAIMTGREKQAQNLANKLVQQSEMTGYPIVILGKAYKPGVPYLEGSYSLLVGHYIEQCGYKCHFIDPMTGDYYDIDTPCVFLLAHNPEITYKYTAEKNDSKLYCDIPAGSVVIDPWRLFKSTTDNVTVIHYGNSRGS